MAPQTHFCFDKHGDLTLSVGTKPNITTFQVCSASMRRASPVWEAMLFGGWSESKPAPDCNQPWIVHLPEDKAEPLSTFLAAIHGVFDHAELYMIDLGRRPGQLFDMPTLADKYDLLRWLHPWASGFVVGSIGYTFGTGIVPPRGMRHCSSADLDATFLLQSTFITWELGYAEGFTVRAKQICANSAVDGNGHLLLRVEGGKDIVLGTWDHLGPADLLDHMASMRREVIQRLLDKVYVQLHLQRGKTPPHCTEPDGIMCDTYALGCFARKVLEQYRSLDLPREADLIDDTPREFARWLWAERDEAKVCSTPDDGSRRHTDRCELLPDAGIPDRGDWHVASALDELFEVLPFPTERHNATIEAQRKKTGITKWDWL